MRIEDQGILHMSHRRVFFRLYSHKKSRIILNCTRITHSSEAGRAQHITVFHSPSRSSKLLVTLLWGHSVENADSGCKLRWFTSKLQRAQRATVATWAEGIFTLTRWVYPYPLFEWGETAAGSNRGASFLRKQRVNAIPASSRISRWSGWDRLHLLEFLESLLSFGPEVSINFPKTFVLPIYSSHNR